MLKIKVLARIFGTVRQEKGLIIQGVLEVALQL
jgi:hypothetical protein